MTCEWVQASIEHLGPTTEVSDAFVEHLDTCASCRDAFDARFPPVIGPRAVPDASPTRPWGPLAVMGVGVAAVFLLRLGYPPPTGFDDRIVMLDHSQTCVVVWEPPECDEDYWPFSGVR